MPTYWLVTDGYGQTRLVPRYANTTSVTADGLWTNGTSLTSGSGGNGYAGSTASTTLLGAGGGRAAVSWTNGTGTGDILGGVPWYMPAAERVRALVESPRPRIEGGETPPGAVERARRRQMREDIAARLELGPLPNPPPIPTPPPHYRARAEANARAEALLLEHLSTAQRYTLEHGGWFDVESPRSGYTYRIHRGRAGNVYRVNADGTRLARYCIHPAEYVPDADTMLTQMLWLMTDEALFLRTANASNP